MKVAIALILLGRVYGQPRMDYPLPGQDLGPDQIDELVAPVALYPDPLLSQILVASTYPLELVRAMQWLDRNRGLTGSGLTQAAQLENWDPSVQALVIFPDLVRRLNQDITWTTNLGNAFLAQQNDVMDGVQRMRQKAEQAGRLSSSGQQTVSTTSESGRSIIVIEPADAYTMYVPYYDPIYIWGQPRYYPYPRWDYPTYGAGTFFGFGAGIRVGAFFGGGWGGWGGWGWNPGWGGRTVIVNNNFFYRNNYNWNRGGSRNPGGAWIHNGQHRLGVPYSNPSLVQRYGGAARQTFPVRPPVIRTMPRVTGGGGDRVGNRMIQPITPGGDRSVFGGLREGGAARGNSDHGHSSLGGGRGAGTGGGRQPGGRR